MINIRNLSVKCASCGEYQTLVRFEPAEDWNAYTYECEGTACDPAASRTLLEVPVDLDAFARRDPTWKGGKRHAGAEPSAETEPSEPAEKLVTLGDS